MDSLAVIARISTDFPTKFGVPRQSGLVASLKATIIFEPEYRNPDAVRGLEDFSHLWLIWGFSAVSQQGWSPTVRPPRLGGNTRKGVFATRSPFRPNPIGLSSVRLEKIENTSDSGVVLRISGADLMDGTPIYDIKPYLPYTDCHPDATGGFSSLYQGYHLEVVFPPELLAKVEESLRPALIGVLEQDPRPSYQHNPDRIYGMSFADLEVKFQVNEPTLTVVSVEKR